MAEGIVLDALAKAVDALPGAGEDRPGQRELTVAVADAMLTERHLVAQAGTGSGKSLAYLVPALVSGLRVVVATATLALQDQLWRKDVPHVLDSLDLRGERSAAMLKGRSNYLCKAKLEDAQDEGTLFETRPTKSFAADLRFLTKWAGATVTGDEADLPESVAKESWRALTCGPGECPGAAKCFAGDECFAEAARTRAATADLLIVNTSLYCAHLASGGYVLPEHDVVIFDEAHELPDIATRAFGIDCSAPRLRALAARLRRVVGDEKSVERVASLGDELERVLGYTEGRVRPDRGDLAVVLNGAAEAVATATAAVNRVKDDGDAADATAAQAAMQLGSGALLDLRRLAAPAEDEVAWVEGGRYPTLRLAPVEVGVRLADALLTKQPCIFVSATMGSGDRFDSFARAAGLDPAAEPEPVDRSGSLASDTAPGYVALRAESPFDFREQAYLYVPRRLPEPRDPAWEAAAGQELGDLIEAADGHALVLCTSRAAVVRFVTLLRERFPDHRIIAQDDGPKALLVEQFTADERAVLVATRSFWQGVDVPGSTLSLVVVDKLPFARPDDPLEQARRALASKRGENPFVSIDVPRAALALAQGVGRLVRSRTDRGVVAVLDSRLANAGYRAALLAALPPFRRSVDGDEVRTFLRGLVAASADATVEVDLVGAELEGRSVRDAEGVAGGSHDVAESEPGIAPA